MRGEPGMLHVTTLGKYYFLKFIMRQLVFLNPGTRISTLQFFGLTRGGCQFFLFYKNVTKSALVELFIQSYSVSVSYTVLFS